MKRFLIAILAVLTLVAPAIAQQSQPSILETPTQYNPINSRAVAAGVNTATVTIAGVTGQRVRVYYAAVQCVTTGGNFIPTIVLSDGTGAVLFQTSGMTFSNITFPVGEYHWLPGLAFAIGSTVTIQGNIGGACTGGTIVHVQADQF